MRKSAEKACLMLAVRIALWCYSLHSASTVVAILSFSGNGGDVRSLVQMEGICVVPLPLKAAAAFAACMINCCAPFGKR